MVVMQVAGVAKVVEADKEVSVVGAAEDASEFIATIPTPERTYRT
jgi:hypothetical protein